jgi:hypothetical protein
MATNTDSDLVHWRTLPERKQALDFSEHGWALTEACALLGDFRQPEDMIALMLNEIINGFVEEGTKEPGPALQIHWQMPEDGLTATVTFQTDALKAAAAICGMELGELQSALQSSLEQSLLEFYDEHNNKRLLH